MNRTDFQARSDIRLREARSLFAADMPEGAYYLGGYAVECALKACIAKRTQEHDFPDRKLVDKSYTHDLEKLIEAAGLSEALKKAIRSDERLESAWLMVRAWSEQSRYELMPDEGINRGQVASKMLFAIESSQGGVLRWIRQRW